MNKKILIASLFATLMLLVPMTSVVGVSDVEEDCDCEDVNRYDLLRVKLLLFRLKFITNILLLRFGHIPEVQEKCQEILDVINSNRQWDFPIICDMLEPIWNQLCDMIEELMMLYLYYGSEGYPTLANIIAALIVPIAYTTKIVFAIGVIFDCDWVPDIP